MSAGTTSMRKITVALPSDLVEYADRKAARLSISRSRVIARALSDVQAEEEDRLAAEGYQYYSQEAIEFAEVSAAATAEAFDHAG